MIQGLYIFNKNGVPVFSFQFKENTTQEDIEKGVFTGLSSTLNFQLKELENEDIRSVLTPVGMLIYTVTDGIVYVIQLTEREDEFFGGFLLKQIELEFKETFRERIIDNKEILNVTHSKQIEKQIMDIYQRIMDLYEANPIFFKFFPSNVPLTFLLDILGDSKDLINGFPNQVITIIRQIEEKYTEPYIRDQVMYFLGKYIGYQIGQVKTIKTVTTNMKDVLRLLNEIAIATYQPEKEKITLELCPICRGKKADRMICDFYSGFIEGIFDNPKISVTEVSCRAIGDKKCEFNINKL